MKLLSIIPFAVNADFGQIMVGHLSALANC
jgi:hypothetical protein